MLSTGLMTRSIAKKLHDRNLKLIEWTCKAEEALTRQEALRALKKIRKHSLKLAKLQSKVYNKGVQKEEPNVQPRNHRQNH
jgi:hypothetical protein